jgi:hypothetical protein
MGYPDNARLTAPGGPHHEPDETLAAWERDTLAIEAICGWLCDAIYNRDPDVIEQADADEAAAILDALETALKPWGKWITRHVQREREAQRVPPATPLVLFGSTLPARETWR